MKRGGGGERERERERVALKLLSFWSYLSKEGNAEACNREEKEENIIQNPEFENGLTGWLGRGCEIVALESMEGGKVLPQEGRFFAATTNRTQTWNGIQQEITGRFMRKKAYEISGIVRISGNSGVDTVVQATLWILSPSGREQYIVVGK